MQLFRNPLIGLAVPVILLALGAINAATDGDRQTRQATARDTAQAQVAARLESSQAAAQADLARSRYQGPCVWISQGQVVEGAAFADSTGQPLTDGVTVCDSFGATAVIREGVAAQVARTADQSVVRLFLGW